MLILIECVELAHLFVRQLEIKHVEIGNDPLFGI